MKKVSGVGQFVSLDPIDLQESSHGEADRASKRLALIKRFLSFAKKEKSMFMAQNSEEKIHIKRTISYQRFLTGFGVFSSLAVYHCFFTKIYDFRSREILNMRSVPFMLRFSATCGVSFFMCRKMWEDHIYDPELYKLALKYR